MEINKAKQGSWDCDKSEKIKFPYGDMLRVHLLYIFYTYLF
jgi:hypothetical protein